MGQVLGLKPIRDNNTQLVGVLSNIPILDPLPSTINRQSIPNIKSIPNAYFEHLW